MLKADCCLAALRLRHGQIMAFKHTAKTTANGQLSTNVLLLRDRRLLSLSEGAGSLCLSFRNGTPEQLELWIYTDMKQSRVTSNREYVNMMNVQRR